MRLAIAIVLLGVMQLAAQDMQSCPMHKEHMKEASQHQADVEKHGDEAMGFPHDKTTHHFRLYPDGGAIEVTANDTNDTQDIQAIRSHLTHIASMFSDGDFSIPMFIHAQTPPGAPVMKQKRTQISYRFEELPAGGRVRITPLMPRHRKPFTISFASKLRITIPQTQPTLALRDCVGTIRIACLLLGMSNAWTLIGASRLFEPTVAVQKLLYCPKGRYV
jgi:hypothetical protein